MNHYPHHLGDYNTGTAGFTQGEHGAYRLLMDAYYSAEEPLYADDVYSIGKATNTVERKAVDKVLARKFDLRGGRYYHKRIEDELEAYRARAETARVNGKLGGKKPKPNPPGNQSGNPVGYESATQSGSGIEPSTKLASSHKETNPPVKAQLSSVGNIPADEQRVAALLSLCASHRVQTPDAKGRMHVRQWAAEGVTDQQLGDAIIIGRDRVGETQPLRIGYLVPIVAELRSGRLTPKTYDPDEVARRAMASIAAKEAGNATH